MEGQEGVKVSFQFLTEVGGMLVLAVSRCMAALSGVVCVLVEIIARIGD